MGLCFGCACKKVHLALPVKGKRHKKTDDKHAKWVRVKGPRAHFSGFVDADRRLPHGHQESRPDDVGHALWNLGIIFGVAQYLPKEISMKNEQLQSELDTLIATQAGLMAIVGSLMATHPHYERFQLHLTGLLEVLLAGDAGKTFTASQRQQAREFVETLQHLNKAPAKIEPLASMPNL